MTWSMWVAVGVVVIGLAGLGSCFWIFCASHRIPGGKPASAIGIPAKVRARWARFLPTPCENCLRSESRESPDAGRI